MLDRSEIPTAALNEVYRLRLAVKCQMERIDEARARLAEIPQQRRNVLMDLATREHFDPAAAADVVKRLGLAEVWIVKNEVQFLVSAVMGIHRMARVMRWATSGEPINDKIQEAMSPVRQEAASCELLRDLHEHTDEVMKGMGKAHSQLPDPDMESVIYLDPDTDEIIYLTGGQIFRTAAMAEAAEALAVELRSLFS
jgi:hypothetical protein